MTDIARTTATERVPMDYLRKTALVAGALYLLTFVSIPRLALFGPILNDPDYILRPGGDTGVLVGVVLELIVALAIVGTGVALFPVLKRQNEGVALGFVAARLFETGIIVVGVISLLAVVTVRRDLGAAAGADAAALVTTGRALVALQDWTFLIGQGLMPGVNALLLGSLLYRSGLVPRVLPALGLVGAPLLISSVFGTLFGINEPVSAWTALGTLPIAVWEFSLGLWLVAKGFSTGTGAPESADVAAITPRPAVVASGE